jgi:hypothetical protein
MLLAPLWSLLVSTAAGAPLANPSPQPAVQLPSVEVTAAKDKTERKTYNSYHEGSFARLRSGPMIEAILWRHHYLSGHPKEEAIILTTHEGNRITSATTVYTKEGKLYASSDVLGESFAIKPLTAADLHSPTGPARALKSIVDTRNLLLDSGDSGSMTFGSMLAIAEETGDYRILGRLAGPPMPVDRKMPEAVRAMVAQAHRDANRAMRDELTKPFVAEASDEVLGWTYQALHDPNRAGIVPVALAPLKGRFPIMNTDPVRYVDDPQVLVFDWEGVQYCYEPDVGTWVQPLPRDPVTGLPYLCIKNGALLEGVYFCASYGKQHPGQTAVLVPGDPAAAAYAADEKLNLFLPTVGRFGLAKQYIEALANVAYLTEIRDKLVSIQKQRGTAPSALPQEMVGDDGDMQMRRAFIAFQAMGVPCRLEEEGPPAFQFTWDGVAYLYSSDQLVHRLPKG